MTVRGALLTLLGAIVLAVPFYFIIGFPGNVPLAVGSAVLLGELAEAALGAAGITSAVVVRSLWHSVLSAFASWLGVLVVRLFGGFG